MNNQPAFPAPQFAVQSGVDNEKIVQLGVTQGMSIRTYAAIAAMQGFLANSDFVTMTSKLNKPENVIQVITVGAVEAADKLLAELQRTEGSK